MCKHGVLACLCIAMRKRVYNSIKRIQKKRREMRRNKKSFSCFAYITCLVISCAALFVRSHKSRLFSLRLLKKVTEHREPIVYTYMGRRTSSASNYERVFPNKCMKRKLRFVITSHGSALIRGGRFGRRKEFFFTQMREESCCWVNELCRINITQKKTYGIPARPIEALRRWAEHFQFFLLIFVYWFQSFSWFIPISNHSSQQSRKFFTVIWTSPTSPSRARSIPPEIAHDSSKK